jgi:hypothetical protein
MNKIRSDVLDLLRNSSEPSIRYSIAHFVDKKDPKNPELLTLQDEIKNSNTVQALLSNVNMKHAYSKWQGAHWVLSLLAELHYPEGDKNLVPLLEKVYGWLFSKSHLDSIRNIKGKWRRCASQEGNAIWYSLKLGITDEERNNSLVERLLEYQWEDGGWNCDKDPKAVNSSYNESLIPFRAIISYSQHLKATNEPGTEKLQDAISSAREVFLKRKIFLSQSTGEEIKWRDRYSFTNLHFPYYWRYNILFALKVMDEGGFLTDPRCEDALDLLESKELTSGGFPAEIRYYGSLSTQSRSSAVNWGGVKKDKMNEWVSAEAYSILSKADRMNL